MRKVRDPASPSYAVGIFRTLPVPFGTVGNTIDLAYTPSSYNLVLSGRCFISDDARRNRRFRAADGIATLKAFLQITGVLPQLRLQVFAVLQDVDSGNASGYGTWRPWRTGTAGRGP